MANYTFRLNFHIEKLVMEVFNTLFIQFAQNDHLFNIGCHAKIQESFWP